jgi:hypothetical protein
MALECVSDDIEETKQKTHTCPKCNQDSGIPKAHTDGVKKVVARHGELPGNTFQVLGKARAKLVHQGQSVASWALISREKPEQRFSLLSILEQLTAEAIAISLKSDPEIVHVVDTKAPDMTIVGQFEYTVDNSPRNRWPKSIHETLAEVKAVQGGSLMT